MKSQRCMAHCRSYSFLTHQRRQPSTKPSSPIRTIEEDDPLSTAPSGPPTTRILPRSLPSSPRRDRWCLFREVSLLERLRSALLQWTFANGLQDAANRQLTRKVEDELYDRGRQVSELLPEVMTERNSSQQRHRAKSLVRVLDMESSLLTSVRDELEELAEALETVETAACFSLRRMQLHADPRALLGALKKAQHQIQRIEAQVRRVMPHPSVVQPLKALATVIASEQREVLDAFMHLSQLRALYADEAALVLRH